MSREPRERAGLYAPYWQENAYVLDFSRATLGFALMPVFCVNHLRK